MARCRVRRPQAAGGAETMLGVCVCLRVSGCQVGASRRPPWLPQRTPEMGAHQGAHVCASLQPLPASRFSKPDRPSVLVPRPHGCRAPGETSPWKASLRSRLSVLELSALPVSPCPPLSAAIFKARQNVERAAPSARQQGLILSAPCLIQPEEPRLRVCPAGKLSSVSGESPRGHVTLCDCGWGRSDRPRRET